MEEKTEKLDIKEGSDSNIVTATKDIKEEGGDITQKSKPIIEREITKEELREYEKNWWLADESADQSEDSYERIVSMICATSWFFDLYKDADALIDLLNNHKELVKKHIEADKKLNQIAGDMDQLKVMDEVVKLRQEEGAKYPLYLYSVKVIKRADK